MRLTYHHYGASLIHAPIDQLQRDMQDMLGLPAGLARREEREASAAAIAVAAQAGPRPGFPLPALQPAATAILEGASDHTAATYTLSYSPATRAPGLIEYSITCTLQSVADAPPATFVEWTRAYQPAAPTCHVQLFARTLVDQDQAIAARLAAKYGGAEVMTMDYTLGGAGAL